MSDEFMSNFYAGHNTAPTCQSWQCRRVVFRDWGSQRRKPRQGLSILSRLWWRCQSGTRTTRRHRD